MPFFSASLASFKTIEIVALTLADNLLYSPGVAQLAAGLAAAAPPSLSIDLHHNGFPLGPAGAAALAPAIHPRLTSLDLNLRGAAIGPEGALVLAKAIERVPRLVALALDLDANELGAHGGAKDTSE